MLSADEARKLTPDIPKYIEERIIKNAKAGVRYIGIDIPRDQKEKYEKEFTQLGYVVCCCNRVSGFSIANGKYEPDGDNGDPMIYCNISW